MPIKLTSTLPSFARYKVGSGNLAFGTPGGDTGEIRFAGLQFAVDLENALPGWLRISDNGPDFVPGTLNQPPPPAPSPDHVWTVMLHIWSPRALGDDIFTFCDQSLAFRKFAEKLFNQCEPLFGRGQVPIVKIIDTPIIQTRRGPSTQILFEIEKWIDRPDAFNQAIALREANMALKKANPGSDYAAISGHDSEYHRPSEEPLNDAPPITEADINSEIPF